MENPNKAVNSEKVAASSYSLRDASRATLRGHFSQGEVELVFKETLLFPPIFNTYVFNFQHSQPTSLHLLCLRALAVPGHVLWKERCLPHMLTWPKSPQVPFFQAPHPMPLPITQYLTCHLCPKFPFPASLFAPCRVLTLPPILTVSPSPSYPTPNSSSFFF